MIKYSLFLAICYTALCDNDIRMQRNFRQFPSNTDFPIYWNVPSFMCLKHGVNFSEYTQRFGILANAGDSFRGDKVNIFYDAGAFPAFLKSSSGGIVARNGGIPQNGNLTFHLDLIKKVVEELLPENYCGMACLDFEAYRPIFRQNWNDQEIYTNMSKEEVRQQHPQWDERTIGKVAARNFERSTRIFMESTLEVLKEIRPCAQWGYYGFPYCYNFRSGSGMKPWCHKDVMRDNNQIQWLFDGSKALYPSLYLSQLDPVDTQKFVLGRMNEAARVAFRAYPGDIPKIHPYMWYKYPDSAQFLSQWDFYIAMETVRKYKVGGYVIWGASNDFTTEDKCKSVLSYLINVIGPTAERVRLNALREQQYDEEIDFQGMDIGNSQNPPKNLSSYYYNYGEVVSESKPTLQMHPKEPSVVIYSAVGPNGTNTIYQYEKNSKPQISNEIPAINNVKYTIVTETPKVVPKTPKPDRTIRGYNPSDIPYLKAYMRGFNRVLEMMLKRFA